MHKHGSWISAGTFLFFWIFSGAAFATINVVSPSTSYLPGVVSSESFYISVNCSNVTTGYNYCKWTFGDNTPAVTSPAGQPVTHLINGGAAFFKITLSYCGTSTGGCYTDSSLIVLVGQSAQGDTVQSNQLLRMDKGIKSSDGRFFFVYQGDGNLVLYRLADWKVLWASNTGPSTRVGVTVMQGDGNLVIYDTGMAPIWASNTAGNSGSRLVMQGDGNAVIYRPDNRPTWATNTVQR